MPEISDGSLQTAANEGTFPEPVSRDEALAATEGTFRDVQAAPVFRPPDTRTRHDAERAKQLGIRRYVSRRLELFTDIDPEIARTLPPLIDQAYEAWIDYFGELPPNRAGTEYQMTGYVVGDKDRFAAAGMLPEDLLYFEHGQHKGAEFWIYDQEFDYYRRHLLLHEAAHCFMTTMPGTLPPLWYMEGMAEFFAVHRIDATGRARFGLMPDLPEDFSGFGRIRLIRREIEQGRLLDLNRTTALGTREFSRSRSVPYAWSWALCLFLDTHPRYRERFRKLGEHVSEREFYRLLRESFAPDKVLLAAEWDQFIRNLEYGFDIRRNAFEIESVTLLPAQRSVTVRVRADRGWQSTGLLIPADAELAITAFGRTELAQHPKPWVSEPQGITVRYAGGRPIGRLLGGLLPEGATGGLDGEISDESSAGNRSDGTDSPRLNVFDVGEGTTFHAPFRGVLFLRVNDFGSELSDNSGEYEVRISPASR